MQFRTVSLYIYFEDPATLLVSASVLGDLILLWEHQILGGV